MILLANSPAGLRGLQAPENSSFVAAFCQLRWQKAATKELSLEGEALLTSQLGVSQQNELWRRNVNGEGNFAYLRGSRRSLPTL
jgi:hypothetical protein